MATVTYVSADGLSTVCTVSAGRTVMQAAMQSGVDGVAAECGGQLMCSTCHVYVEGAKPTVEVLPGLTDDEDAMLDMTARPRRLNSRLSCQLVVSEALESLTVTLPDAQV